MAKNFYLCSVCGDIHYGNEAPDPCPTCGAKDSYDGIEKEEAGKKMGF